MTWTMHVPGERLGAAQACRLCGYVLQDVSPPPGLIVPATEVELTAREVPWWPPGGRVLVSGAATVDLDALTDHRELDWQTCVPAGAS